MDIHRCRFVPFSPQPINALSFSHTSNLKQNTPRDLRLAIGRENGDIEIWNPSAGQWVQETILRGSVGRTVEQLCWTQNTSIEDQDNDNEHSARALRLFSTGGSTAITEWDLGAGSPKRNVEGNSGDIWCFAAQPTRQEKEQASQINQSQLLAAGCADGSIILFSTDEDDLQYSRVLVPSPKKKAKVLSITWRDRNTVVAGYEDSNIRVVDVPSRAVLRTMSLGKSADGGKSIVWTVKCLPNGTILSGDSTGELKIWDAQNFSLIQRLKTHQADILDIASNAVGNMLFTFGVDRRTVTYQALPVRSGSKRVRWTNLKHRRYHSNDVKCAASYESRDISVLVSGGVDATPIIVPIRKWQTEKHQRLPHLPRQPQVSSSPQARLILTWWQRDLMVYHIPKCDQYGIISDGQHMLDSASHRLLTTLQLQGDEYIQSAQISNNGRYVVAATIAGVRMFQIRTSLSKGKLTIRTRPIDLPPMIYKYGARCIGFSKDNKWLFAVRTDNTISLAKIVLAEDMKDRPTVSNKIVRLTRKARKHEASCLGTLSSNINCVSFSSDCRVLATADLSGSVDTWLLEGHEDTFSIDNDDDARSRMSMDKSSESDSDTDEDEDELVVIHGQKWIRNPAGSPLPNVGSAVLSLTFRPQVISVASPVYKILGLHATRHNPHPVSHELANSDTKLIAITADHKLFEFEVFKGKLSDWSRKNPANQLPANFTKMQDRVMGCFWDCADATKGERLWLYGSSWLFMLNMSQDLPLSKVSKIGRLGNYDVFGLIEHGVHKEPVEQTAAVGLGKKRKRNDSGGYTITNSNNVATTGEQISKQSDDDFEIDTMTIDGDLSKDQSGDDDDIENDDALLRLRRGIHPKNSGKDNDAIINGTHEHASDGVDQTNSNGEFLVTDFDAKQSGRAKPPIIPYWSTFKYQPILGIVVLSNEITTPSQTSKSQHNDTSIDPLSITNTNEQINSLTVTKEIDTYTMEENTLEVAIIERPLFDVDQPPRFDGGQDWET